MESLKVPEKYKRPGVYVYCNKCYSYSNIKDGCLRKSPKCNHPPENQIFKLKVHVPGSKNMCRTMALDTRDITEVDKIRTDFIESLKQNNYTKLEIKQYEVPDAERYLLLYQMKKFIDYKSNGGSYEFESSKDVEKETIKDYERHFRYFLDSLCSYVNIKTIRIEEIKKEHIEVFHKYIKQKTNYLHTYNNIMSSLRSFFNHLIKYEEFDIRNIFTLVPVHSVHYDPVTFTAEEFDKILEVTTIENGYDKTKKRNHYRSWLKTSFKLGAFTDLRLDELVHMKYSDIEMKDGVLVLQAENMKATKLIGAKQPKDKRIKRIPVIEELRKVLYEECEYEQNIGSDKFIIAPQLARITVHNTICKGFTHFKRLAGIDEQKCFKELRKTYMNQSEAQFGITLTTLVSDHSNDEVVRKHYLAQMEAVKKTAGLKIFPKKDENE